MLGCKYLYWRQQKIHKIKNSESSSCLPLDHRSSLYHLNTKTFSPWEWSNTVIDCPEKSWSLPSCKCSKPDWTQAWAACFSWPCFSRGVRLGDLKRLLPTYTILWFWDPLPRVPTWKRKLGCSKTAEVPDALLPVLGAWEGSCVLEKHWCWGSRQRVLPCHRGRLRAEWEESLCLQHEGGMCVVQGFGTGEMVLCGLCLVLTEEHWSVNALQEGQRSIAGNKLSGESGSLLRPSTKKIVPAYDTARVQDLHSLHLEWIILRA